MTAKFLSITGATALLSAIAATSAQADSFLIEAENSAVPSPMVIKDAFAGTTTPASQGRYIEVLAGKNNNSGSQPVADSSGTVAGQVCYGMFFQQAGDYRFYGRVIAPTTADDSFWVRVQLDSQQTPPPWIAWNTIKLGSAWHWDSVHLGNSTSPLLFHFEASTGATLCVAPREDGAKLDSLLVTNDPAVNPITATKPVAANVQFGGPVPQVLHLDGKSSLFFEWTAVPGATSYTVKNRIPQPNNPAFNDPPNDPMGTPENCFNTKPERFTAIKSNVTNGFTFVDTNATRLAGSCYLVEATGGGVTVNSSIIDAQKKASDDPFVLDVQESSVFDPVSLPLEDLDTITRTNPTTHLVESVESGGLGSRVTAPKQTDATKITQGFGRWQFQLPEATTLRVWGLVTFFDTASDSFWVRMDGGTWLKWNGWKADANTGCPKDVFVDGQPDPVRNGGGWMPVWDGDSPAAPKKTFSLAAGTHTLEIALREPGAGMDRIVLTNDSVTGVGGCFD